MKLFKLLRHRFAESLTQEGGIRVTTLFECRKIESAGTGRVDPEEAIRYTHISMGISRSIPFDHSDPEAWTAEQLRDGLVPIVPGMVIGPVDASLFDDAPDAFL